MKVLVQSFKKDRYNFLYVHLDGSLITYTDIFISSIWILPAVKAVKAADFFQLCSFFGYRLRMISGSKMYDIKSLNLKNTYRFYRFCRFSGKQAALKHHHPFHIYRLSAAAYPLFTAVSSHEERNFNAL